MSSFELGCIKLSNVEEWTSIAKQIAPFHIILCSLKQGKWIIHRPQLFSVNDRLYSTPMAPGFGKKVWISFLSEASEYIDFVLSEKETEKNRLARRAEKCPDSHERGKSPYLSNNFIIMLLFVLRLQLWLFSSS